MLKTSEKNSDTTRNAPLLKRLKGWAIDLYRRYRYDIFFSTRIQIILFYTFSVLVIVLVMADLFSYAQETTVQSINESLQRLLLTGEFNQEGFKFTFAQVQGVKEIVFTSIVVLALIFGTLGTFIALRPMREALALQRQFITSVAHELRTPLAILRVENEIAKFEPGVPPKCEEIFTRNVEEIDSMTDILNNLLLFNRVSTFESISFDMVDLNPVIASVEKHLAPLATQNGVRFQILTMPMPEVYGNATALKQAIFNLIKNAIHYTKSGGNVTVQCTAITEKHVTITVEDTGQGIARGDLPHIFEPFFRSTNGYDDRQSAGLGLAIVFEIIKLHQGTIRVASTVGKGSTFSVTIPRQPHARQPKTTDKEGNVFFDFSAPLRS